MKIYLDLKFKKLLPTAVALGFFNGIHKGHKEVIKAAVAKKKDGFEPSVFTFTTKSLKPEKKQKSLNIYSESTKENIIEKLGIENYICPDFLDFKEFSGDDFFKKILVGKLNAKYIFCGKDFEMGKNKIGISEIAALSEKYNINFEIINSVTAGRKKISTTEIRKLLESGNMEEANLMLGREYSYNPPVLKGNKIGRIIGYRTINQEFAETNIIPKFGVYKSKIKIKNRWYDGLTNIGVKPTVGSPLPISETHILAWKGRECYGEKIEVRLLKFIRDERKFDSLELLKKQIEKDIEEVLRDG